jgi:hypothetical protein
VNDVTETIDDDRRRFFARAAMTIAALAAAAEANGAPRELTALTRAKDWLNSTALTNENLSWKVVIVDFWTYTCINWLRTLPYIRAWAQKCSRVWSWSACTRPIRVRTRPRQCPSRGTQMGIEYPIAIDNDYAIWRAFDNNYWPALYFVDARGRVRQHQFGEGSCDRSRSRFNGYWRRQVRPAAARTSCR